jgi:uncharacterized membrane protein
MLVGSLTFSLILITVEFQTGSAIVMAVAGGHTVKFYIHNRRGWLVWKDRDVSTCLEFRICSAQPGVRTLE